jgi:hypothetical protein
MNTGGKIALGVGIPIAIIALAVGGIFVYDKVNNAILEYKYQRNKRRLDREDRERYAYSQLWEDGRDFQIANDDAVRRDFWDSPDEVKRRVVEKAKQISDSKLARGMSNLDDPGIPTVREKMLEDKNKYNDLKVLSRFRLGRTVEELENEDELDGGKRRRKTRSKQPRTHRRRR